MIESFLIKFLETLSILEPLYAHLLVLGVLFISGMGVPIPEDISLITAGILVSMGKMSFLTAHIVGFVGVLSGDCILFFLGKTYGVGLLKNRFFKKLFSQKRLDKARVQIQKNGRLICFVARFLPGIRSAVFFTAGTMGVKTYVFLSLDGLAAVLSVPFWIIIGYLFGNNVNEILIFVHKANIYIFISIGVLVLVYLWYFQKKKFSFRMQQKEG